MSSPSPSPDASTLAIAASSEVPASSISISSSKKSPPSASKMASSSSWALFAPSKGEALAHNLLEVRESSIEGAGLGVFSRIDIPKGANVLEYTGKLKKCVGDDDANAHGCHRYCFEYDSNHCIDATCKKEGGKGRYVNDTHGTNRKPNLEWTLCKRLRKVFMTSTRPIKHGSELFISYGKAYWKYHDECLARKQKRLAKKQERDAAHAAEAESAAKEDEMALDVLRGTLVVVAAEEAVETTATSEGKLVEIPMAESE